MEKQNGNNVIGLFDSQDGDLYLHLDGMEPILVNNTSIRSAQILLDGDEFNVKNGYRLFGNLNGSKHNGSYLLGEIDLEGTVTFMEIRLPDMNVVPFHSEYVDHPNFENPVLAFKYEVKKSGEIGKSCVGFGILEKKIKQNNG
jgi:hypothetical protein